MTPVHWIAIKNPIHSYAMNGKRFKIFGMWLGRTNANIRAVEEEAHYEKTLPFLPL